MKYAYVRVSTVEQNEERQIEGLEKHGIDTLFIFTHGATLRAFLLRWFHYSPEWYEDEHNPKNCWIREIKDGKDLGYINKDVEFDV